MDVSTVFFFIIFSCMKKGSGIKWMNIGVSNFSVELIDILRA
jgi:hypothetical protein